MLAPRVRRGGTMRPENSSKLWLKTVCERSRASTVWSIVTPLRPAVMAACEIPLAAASLLKLVSHASKLPVPQEAASDGVPNRLSTAQSANALIRGREVVDATGAGIRFTWDVGYRAVQNVSVNRGQNMAMSAMFASRQLPP